MNIATKCTCGMSPSRFCLSGVKECKIFSTEDDIGRKHIDSDARQTPPSFDEMVELIKTLFTDYMEDFIKAKPSEIAKSWDRYKTLNHLY